jgi:hypothetical protein
MPVQRYDWDEIYMTRRDDGDYVEYGDYEWLERENAELRQAINRLEEESRG